MIAYVTLGTNDLARAAAFWDGIAGVLGVGRMMEQEGRFVAWGEMGGPPGVGVTVPFDGAAATAGNGTMVALAAADRAQVRALHALALQMGGADEGAPGMRGEMFYAGYFRDLDGNKVSAFTMAGE